MRVKVRRTAWTIRDVEDLEHYGECFYPGRTIELRSDQQPRVRLDTLIHELLHALRPDFPEREIYAIAKTVSEGIWKDKWRRINQSGH